MCARLCRRHSSHAPASAIAFATEPPSNSPTPAQASLRSCSSVRGGLKVRARLCRQHSNQAPVVVCSPCIRHHLIKQACGSFMGARSRRTQCAHSRLTLALQPGTCSCVFAFATEPPSCKLHLMEQACGCSIVQGRGGLKVFYPRCLGVVEEGGSKVRCRRYSE